MLKGTNGFEGKAGMLVRALLQEPERPWKGSELAQALGMTPAWANRVIERLANERILQKGSRGCRSSGIRLLNPQILLKRWTTYYSFRHHGAKLYLVQNSDPVKYLHRACKELGASYALTGYAAANLIIPSIENAIPMAYFKSKEPLMSRQGIARLENDYDFIPVLKKANLILLELGASEDILYGRQKIAGFYVVSPLQLFLDLYTMGPERFVIDQLAAYWRKHKIPYDF